MNLLKDIQIIKNFITNDEKEILNQWSLNNFNNKRNNYSDANMGKKHTRFTTRYNKNCDDIEFPNLIFEIQNKIITHLKIKNFLFPPFCHGVVNGIGFAGGSIYNHKDPNWFNGHTTLHCNIISSKPNSGGVTVINDVPYETEETDLLVFSPSTHFHYVTENIGDTQRILWVFGFCIPTGGITKRVNKTNKTLF